MSRSPSLQGFVHWLETGAGGRAVRIGAFVFGVAVLSLLAGYKQFRGARTEVTLAQADLGWQLGTGQGFTTRVKYPQTAAWLEAHGEKFADRAAFPSLADPPLYPLVIGAGIAALPSAWRGRLFDKAPVANTGAGFGGDYLLLGINLLLLWTAAALTWALARQLFSERVALVSALGLLLSAGVWSETIAVNGTPLSMVLLLALALLIARADTAADAGRRAWPWWAAAGGAAGLLFLCDYPAGVAVVAVFWCAAVFPGGGRWAAVAAALAFSLVVTPWVAHELKLTGSPIGLAWQDATERAGDPTADPPALRATFSAAAPGFSLNKFGNRGLSAVHLALGGQLWSGGGLFFTAFFVAGLVYRFRGDPTRRLHWAALGLTLALILSHAGFGTGEGERLPTAYAAPLIIVFGAGFFSVLVASGGRLATHAGWAAVGLLVLQAAPLAHDLLEPGRQHYTYPPYHPSVFAALRGWLKQNAADPPVWMADVPAGASWYSGLAVWAQPTSLDDLATIAKAEPPFALLLTSHTLERPYWATLTADSRPAAGGPAGWAPVYAALASAGPFPAAFPFRRPNWIDHNLVLLSNPAGQKPR
jgi:hypothetical protein